MARTYVSKASVQKRLDALCRGFDRTYPVCTHHARIIPISDPKWTNWYPSPETVGNGASLSALREALNEIREEMPMIEPGEL